MRTISLSDSIGTWRDRYNTLAGDFDTDHALLSAVDGRLVTAEGEIDSLQTLTSSHTGTLSSYGSRITANETDLDTLLAWKDEIGDTSGYSTGLSLAIGGGTFAEALSFLYALGTGSTQSATNYVASGYVRAGSQVESNEVRVNSGSTLLLTNLAGTTLSLASAAATLNFGGSAKITVASSITLGAAMTSAYRITANELYVGANAVWHAGNDGAASGLDADTVDGLQASAFALVSHTHAIADITGLQTALDAKLASSSYTAADVLTKVKTVDGASSGLDADLLDGLQASAFALVSHTHAIADVTGLQSALDAKLASSSYTAADVLTKVKTVDGTGSGLDADLLDGQQGTYFAGLSRDEAITGNWQFSTALTLGDGDLVDADPLLNFNMDVDWSFIQDGNSTTASLALVAGVTGDNRFKIYNFEKTKSIDFAPNLERITVGASGAFYVGTNLVWHAGNDGSGSGLDADTVDGLQASAFAAASHTHATSAITSGTFADARIAASNVTQHQASLSIGWSQLTSVPSTFTPSAHVHAASDITSGTFAVARIPALSYLSSSGGSLSGSLSVTGNISATGEVTAYSSDADLKMKVEDVESALDRIMQLRGVNFEWNAAAHKRTKDLKHGKRIGLLYQNVKEVFPEATDEFEDGYGMVAYGALMGAVVEAIKELKREIDGRTYN